MYWARSNHSVQACDEDEYLRGQKGWDNEKGKQVTNEPHFLGPLHNQSCCQWQRTLVSQHNSNLIAGCGNLWVKFFLGTWPNPSICHDSQNDLQNEDNLVRSAASR